MGNCILVATPYNNKNIRPQEAHELSIINDSCINNENNK